MRKLVSIILIFIFNAGNAQQVISRVDTFHISYLSSKLDWGAIPSVISSDENIQTAINKTIINELFDLEPDQSLTEFIEDYESTNNFQAQMNFYHFEVLRNDDKLLVIRVDVEGCGAYCEGYEVYLNFDLATGDILKINDVFTAMQHQQIDSFLIATKKGMIANALLASSKVEESEDVNCERQVLNDCFDGSEVGSAKIALLNDTVMFEIGRCSNHALRACDPFDNFTFYVPAISGFTNLLFKDFSLTRKPKNILAKEDVDIEESVSLPAIKNEKLEPLKVHEEEINEEGLFLPILIGAICFAIALVLFLKKK